VHYEARERGIPVVVSPYDTHETAARFETLLQKVRFDHPEKLSRMVELASSNLDLRAVEQAVAQPATG
jgi:BioD-like phosphotransacetylase family protein